MDRPMARGTEPLMSLRLSSHTASTVRTRTKVISASMKKPCTGVTLLLMVVMPSELTTSLGVSA